MKKFNLEEAKAGKPVCTRDGRDLTILKFDAKRQFPIIGIVNDNGRDNIYEWDLSGKYLGQNEETISDLMMASVKHEGWVRILEYSYGKVMDAVIYNSKKDAENTILSDSKVVKIFHIEWEE